MTLFGTPPAVPAGVKEAARLALSAALKDPRTGFSVKAAMMSGAYDAFSEAVEAAIEAAKLAEEGRWADAILAERENWKGAAEAAFDEGVAQERERCVGKAAVYAGDILLGPEARLCAGYIAKDIRSGQ